MISYLRMDGTASILVLLNFSATPEKYALPYSETGWRFRLSNRAVEPILGQGNIELAAYQGIILEPGEMNL
jgi:hypothetical protein